MFRLYENWRGNRLSISKFVTQKKISSICTEVAVAQAKSAGLEADRKFVNLSHDNNLINSKLYFRILFRKISSTILRNIITVKRHYHWPMAVIEWRQSCMNSLML